MNGEGEPVGFTLAHLRPPGPTGRLEGPPYEVLPPRAIHGLPGDFDAFIDALEDEWSRRATTAATVDQGLERAILVGVSIDGASRDFPARLAELEALARSAGVEVCEVITQRRARYDPRYLVGQGKLEELVLRSLQHDATVLILDANLTPTQAKNISAQVDLKIIDRTQLILDIFAQRARSADGKLQVELARLRYLLPYLVGGGRSLSRIRGGIGGNRGVGEQKLELDRRRFRRRIQHLERDLARMARRRRENRKERHRRGLPVIALVGYTNAGKSTWLRTLTGAPVLVADQLFATLDTTSRRLTLPGGRECLLSDTVGFIRDLPEDLVSAFRATLEELAEATLLVQVADASDPEVFQRMTAVNRILEELELLEIPRLVLFNKADRVDLEAFRPLIAEEPTPALLVSALDAGDARRASEALEEQLEAVAPLPGAAQPGTPEWSGQPA
jgi:GTP-binding protein HflX